MNASRGEREAFICFRIRFAVKEAVLILGMEQTSRGASNFSAGRYKEALPEVFPNQRFSPGIFNDATWTFVEIIQSQMNKGFRMTFFSFTTFDPVGVAACALLTPIGNAMIRNVRALSDFILLLPWVEG